MTIYKALLKQLFFLSAKKPIKPRISEVAMFALKFFGIYREAQSDVIISCKCSVSLHLLLLVRSMKLGIGR